MRTRRPPARGPRRVRGGGGAPGAPDSATAAGQFDGGYAYVIRASDHPVRPVNHARPSDPARPANLAYPAAPDPADVYVYRDTSAQPDGPGAPARRPASEAPLAPDESDASYWYDLSGESSAPAGEDT